MRARLLALFLGTALAALLLGVVLWVRNRPDPLHDIPIHVIDARGQAVERFGWEVWDDSPGPGEYYSTSEFEAQHPGGTAVVRARRHHVRFDIRARGFSTVKLGPFGPDSLPTRLEVVLPDIGLVRGVVTHGGHPVIGAKVELLMQHPDVAEGVPSGLFYGFEDLRGRTDDRGVFEIGSDWPGMPYMVRACTQDFATGMAGPARVGDPPIEINLPDGGTIDGTLRTHDGQNAGGVAVELYREAPSFGPVAECETYTAITDPLGRFRFNHIDGGAWLVRLANSEVRGSARERVPLDLLPFVVEVRDGQTTQLDMDLAKPVAHLDGHLLLSGKPWSNAYVSLSVVGDRAFVVDEIQADEAGSWSMRARATGKYRLVVRGDREHHGEPSGLSDIVDLTYDGVEWHRDVAWDQGAR